MRKALLISGLLCYSAWASAEVKGIAQLSLVQTDELTSFLNSGTGVLRYDEDGLNIQQFLVSVKTDINSDWGFTGVAHYYGDGDQSLGVSQLFAEYKPLSSSKTRFKARIGAFYPEMSLENVDIGWLSPYTYTNSAINSWIGEELRVVGAEAALFSPGRSRNSMWSWELNAGLYKGNDPAGTVLSWRGFATHDRQSLHHERLEFAPYPSVVRTDRVWHPAWVEPFKEIDGRYGYYLGAHLSYTRKAQLRYYYYDNNADPLAVNDQRLYAWDTQFHSLALQYRFSNGTRFLGQWMTGQSLMGEALVNIDFNANFAMLSHKLDNHRFSLRYDHFEVIEKDDYTIDYNDSHGHAWTLAWRYQYSDKIRYGLEWHENSNWALNRMAFSLETRQTQSQWLAVSEFRF